MTPAVLKKSGTPIASQGANGRRIPLSVLALVPYLYDTAPGQRFRAEQWAKLLEPHGVRFEFVPFESPSLKKVLYHRGHYGRKMLELIRGAWRRGRILTAIQRQWDAILVHREALPIGPPVMERMLARCPIPLIYDFDDAVFLPDVSEANRRFWWLKSPQKTATICRLSDQVIVGNDYLKRYALQFTSKVCVIPTTIDTECYRPKASMEIRGTPIIGWSGSLTTSKHLRVIEPALQALRRSTPFRLKILGDPQMRMRGLEIESREWVRQTEVEDLQSFDVGVMPLPDDAWARGKCGLKLLQYMALGIPAIASPVGVNAEIIQDGTNGFLATTPEEWVEKLGILLSQEAVRRRFAEAARQTVEERFAGARQAARFLDVLQQVARARFG